MIKFVLMIQLLIFSFYGRLNGQNYYKPIGFFQENYYYEDYSYAYDGMANGAYETNTASSLQAWRDYVSVDFYYSQDQPVGTCTLYIFRSVTVGGGESPGECRIEYSWNDSTWYTVENFGGPYSTGPSGQSMALIAPEGANLQRLKIRFSSSPGITMIEDFRGRVYIKQYYSVYNIYDIYVSVTPPLPVISSFRATPSSIFYGESANLVTEFRNGTATIDNGVGNVVSGQSVSVSPSKTTTYTLTVTGIDGRTVSAQATVVVQHRFTQTGNLNYPRLGHSSVLLQDGRVAILGGYDNIEGTRSKIEIYDPNTGQCTVGGEMKIPRSWHASVLLQDGRVLTIGGSGPNGYLQTAEIFDPATGSSLIAANALIARTYPNVIALDKGKIIVCGGLWCQPTNGNCQTLAPAVEIYDPTTNKFSTISGSASPYSPNTATRGGVKLLDGRIFFPYFISNNELKHAYFDPMYEQISIVPSTEPIRTFDGYGSGVLSNYSNGSVILNSGDVLIAGWTLTLGVKTAELYLANSEAWEDVGSLRCTRKGALIKLADGSPFFIGAVGSIEGTDCDSKSTEIFNPGTRVFTIGPRCLFDRLYHSAVLLNDGRVLVTGGLYSPGTAELYK